MRIYIDTFDCRDHRGKAIAVSSRVGIEVEVGEGYDIAALADLKDKLQGVLNAELPKCIQGEGGSK